jgi:UDP-2,4-diacetamido-2,4,6-trideoxy-beta-L-altropyranose hydrolase
MRRGRAKHKILVRADGSKKIGMGHLYRNLRLARYLRKRYGIEVVFLTRNNAVELLKKEKFKVHTLGYAQSFAAEIKTIVKVVAKEKPDAVIVDILDGCFDRKYMAAFRSGENRVIVFNDTARRGAVGADVVFNTNLKPSEAKNGEYYGYDYLILPEEYVSRPRRNINAQAKNVLVCMGGSDHNNLTRRVLNAIDQSGLAFRCDAVVSSAYFNKKDMDALTKRLHHPLRVHYDVDGLLGILKRTDVAITAGGYTQVERMAAGVPGIVINQLRHQEMYTRPIGRMGGCIDLGFHRDISDEAICRSFERLMQDVNIRRTVACRGLEIVDGQGLKRVADIIVRSLV